LRVTILARRQAPVKGRTHRRAKVSPSARRERLAKYRSRRLGRRGLGGMEQDWKTWSWDESLFAGAASYYEQGRLPYAPGLAEAFARCLDLEGQARLLDVGCGPGTATGRGAACRPGAFPRRERRELRRVVSLDGSSPRRRCCRGNARSCRGGRPGRRTRLSTPTTSPPWARKRPSRSRPRLRTLWMDCTAAT